MLYNKLDFLKYTLLPLQGIYSMIVYIKNILYKYSILKSYKCSKPIISIGNLNTGGTGKTPMVEYLLRLFKTKRIAVISKGYKRKSKGFILGTHKHTAREIGDENRQLLKKFNHIIIACHNSKVYAVKKLLEMTNQIDLIILDDGFQHQHLNRDLNILLTEYNNLFTNDHLLPIGQLREHKKEMRRADNIIITKCPKNISQMEKDTIIKIIKPKKTQQLYFSYIRKYKYVIMPSLQEFEINSNQTHILLTGIASTDSITNELNSKHIKFKHLKYQDHYNFTDNDIGKIIDVYRKHTVSNTLLLTEKDYYRLSESHKEKLIKIFNLICMQIEFDFIEADKANFNNQMFKFEE